MTEADRRALIPLFWTHVNLYGKFDLDMSTRLDLCRHPDRGRGLDDPGNGVSVVSGRASGFI